MENIRQAVSKLSETLAKHKLIIIILVGLIFIALGHYLQTVSEDTLFVIVCDVILSVGSTAMAGGIIALTLDRATKRDQKNAVSEDIKHIKTNVFEAVYGRDIPEKMLRDVQTDILSANFIRLSYKIRNEVNIAINTENVVTCICHNVVSYEVKNTSDKTRYYEINLEFMRSKDDNDEQGLDFLSVGDKTYVKEDLASQKPDASVNRPGFIKYSVKTELHAGEQKKVYMSWKETRSLDDHIPWFALNLCDSFQVEFLIRANNELMELIEGHNYGSYTLHPTNGIIEPNGSQSLFCHLDTTVLPFQGFIVWWKLKDTILKLNLNN